MTASKFVASLESDVRDRAWAKWLDEYPDDVDLPRAFQDELLDSLIGHRMIFAVQAADLGEPAVTMLRALDDQLDAAIREGRRKTFEWWGL